MFLRICDSLTNNTPQEWILADRNSSEIFDTLSTLQNFQVVIWSNTSGDVGLTSSQRSNYETFVNDGGSYLGIHAASDTYRHSTANGGSTGTWDFYAEQLSGCSVQQSPNHTQANHNNFMDHSATHPILDNIPDPWNKTEEYYYWENGFLEPTFNALLTVRSTGGNSYDAARMITQYKELSTGGRSFYTALGHATSNFTDPNNEFETFNKNALYWVANPSVSSVQEQTNEKDIVTIYPNPASEVLYVKGKFSSAVEYLIYNSNGQELQNGILSDQKIDLVDLNDGLYFLILNVDGKTIQKTFQVLNDL
jgi:type 1 glutamine amidotransferase